MAHPFENAATHQLSTTGVQHQSTRTCRYLQSQYMVTDYLLARSPGHEVLIYRAFACHAIWVTGRQELQALP